MSWIPSSPARPSALATAALLLSFSLVWSSAFIVGKLGLRDASPYLLLAVRFAFAAAVLALPLLCRRTAPRFGDLALISDAVLLGTLNNVLYLGLTFTALQYISADLVVIVVSCAPFVTAAIAAARGLERLSGRKLLGIAAGFAGVLVITLHRPVGDANLAGLCFALMGTVSFAFGTIFYRSRAHRHDPQTVNFWQSATAAALLAPLAFADLPELQPSAQFAFSVGYLALVVTVGGMWLWLYLIRRFGATSAASSHLANPACALLLSHWILGTPLQASDWIGVAVISAGLIVVIRAPRLGEER